MSSHSSAPTLHMVRVGVSSSSCCSHGSRSPGSPDRVPTHPGICLPGRPIIGSGETRREGAAGAEPRGGCCPHRSEKALLQRLSSGCCLWAGSSLPVWGRTTLPGQPRLRETWGLWGRGDPDRDPSREAPVLPLQEVWGHRPAVHATFRSLSYLVLNSAPE